MLLNEKGIDRIVKKDNVESSNRIIGGYIVTFNGITEFLNTKGINYEVEHDDNRVVTGFCPLNGLREECITWVRHIEDAPVGKLNQLNGMVLVAERGEKIDGLNIPVIYAENAHRTFFRIVEHFFHDQDPENRKPNIASTAMVESENTGGNLYVGHHTYIGPDVTIGEHVTILHNVTLQGKITIGDYTVIESGVVIGACGFGHYDDEMGDPVCVPHLGGVMIGKHVKIGANCTIARGCLADTIIEDYVKVDNLCHIAHNTNIMRGAMLTAGTVVAGSTSIGKRVWLAPGTILNNGITIGDDSFLCTGSVVTKDIPGGKYAAGMPARVYKEK